jgi:Protein of unknown function (DUF2569)/GYF domain 2
MSEVWYYVNGRNRVGPLSKTDLVQALSLMPEPTNILVWRNGLHAWQKATELSELLPHVATPPPLPPPRPSVPLSNIPAEPSVSVEEASHFRHLKPDISGIGGWLILIAIGQVLGPLRMLVALGEYLEKLEPSVTQKFPVAIWGEAIINLGLVFFFVRAAFLFFRRSRKFPLYFIWQWALTIALPFIDTAWVAISFAAYTGRSPSEFASLSPEEVGRSIAAAIIGAIWIAYVLRSKRVANTFIK